MPYIDYETKQKYAELAGLIANTKIENPGVLTWLLTLLAKSYLEYHQKSFSVLCVIVGSFMCATFEFYRRVVGPYEDKKINENGDVY